MSNKKFNARHGLSVGSTPVDIIDDTGAILVNSASATKLATARTISVSGDAVGSVSFDGTSNADIAVTIQPNSVALGTDTTGNYMLNVSPGTGVSVSHTQGEGSTATVSIGQAVGTTDNVTFNNVTVNGTLTSDDITSTNISVAGNATITGNLTVSGTTTTINSTTIAVADLNLELARNATTAAQANGAGVTVTGPTTAATLTYTSADDRWNFNKNLNVTTVYGALSGNASTASAWQTARSISITGDATWTTTIDGSAAATGALTLANSGVTAGTYGSSTSVPVVTVDAKGRITGVTTSAISGSLTFTGDVTGTGSTGSSTALTLAASGVTAGTYTKITVDAKGRATSGTTLSASDIPTLNQNTTGTAASAPLLSNAGQYIWSVSTLPTGYSLGIQSSFVGSGTAAGFQSYGSVMTMNTYSGGGGALQLYVPYSPTYGGTGLQVRFGNYDVSSGNSWTSWKTLLASDNYSSYALPLSGGTLTGVITTVSSGTAINFSGQSDSIGYNATAGLGTYIKGTGNTYVYGGGKFYDGTTSQTLIHSGNIGSQSVSSASSVSGLTLTSSSNGVNPDNVTQNQLGYNTSVSLFGQTDGGLYSSAYSSSWIHQIYGDFRTGQIATRGKNSGTWQAWRIQLDSSNYTSYRHDRIVESGGNYLLLSSGNEIEFFNSAGTIQDMYLQYSGGTSSLRGPSGNIILHAGNYTSYSPSLTGSGASGTWSISITGGNVQGSYIGVQNTSGSSGYGISLYNGSTAGQPQYGLFFGQTASWGTYGGVSADWATYFTMDSTANRGWIFRDTVNGNKASISNTGNATFAGYANINGITIQQGNVAQNVKITTAGGTDSGVSLYNSSGTWLSQWYATSGSYGFLNGNWAGWDLQKVVSGNLLINNNVALHAGNYTSYSPSLTGSGASGAWSISINGSAAQLNNLSKIQLWNNSGNNHSTYQTFSAIPDFGVWFMQNSSASDSPQSGSQYYVRTQGLGNDYGYASYALMTAVARDHATKYTYYRTREGSTWGSWTKTAAGFADTSARASGNFYIDSNYGRGIVGVYSSYRYQGVFAMGDSYKLADDGTSTGSLYGMAWSHPNAGGTAGNLSSHGLLLLQNGGFMCALSTNIVAAGNIVAQSDERLKTNWRDVSENFVTRLAQVKSGIYDRIDHEEVTQVGVGAQSLQKLLPEAIITAADEAKTLSVNYGAAALVSSVELAKEVVDLRARVAQLEDLISKLIKE